jgi:copper chaperone
MPSISPTFELRIGDRASNRGKVKNGILPSSLDLPTVGKIRRRCKHENQERRMLRFHIPNMTCGGCARSVTAALSSVDPKARIEPDPVTREVRIETTAKEEALRAVLNKAGYPVDDSAGAAAR